MHVLLALAGVDDGQEVMNYFGLIVAALQLCAALEACWCHEWNKTLIYIGFSIGSAAVAWK